MGLPYKAQNDKIRQANCRKGVKMGVKKTGEKYRCNVCGNEVVVTKVGGGTLVCCGEDMEKISG
jgi:desulfoferrodoxin-like iron-binding protein